MTEVLTGRFAERHAFLPARMLHQIDAFTSDIAAVQARIDSQLGDLGSAVAKLDAISGIGPPAAQLILAEIALDMSACYIVTLNPAV